MNGDYANQGVLNENHRVSAAFTREQLRRRAIFHPEGPVPAAGMPVGSEADAGEGAEPGRPGPGPALTEPFTSPTPAS